jgi:hypothetical protein
MRVFDGSLWCKDCPDGWPDKLTPGPNSSVPHGPDPELNDPNVNLRGLPPTAEREDGVLTFGVEKHIQLDAWRNFVLQADVRPTDPYSQWTVWRIETFDAEGVLRNTNDGLLLTHEDLSGMPYALPAERADLKVKVPRIPAPLAPVPVIIEVPRLETNIEGWRVKTPPAYVTACPPLDGACDDRWNPPIPYFPRDLGEMMGRVFRMRVTTGKDLAPARWAAEAYNGTRVLAYGDNEGFALKQVPLFLWYPNIPGQTVVVVFDFDCQAPWDTLEVDAQDVLDLTCNLGMGYLQRYLLNCTDEFTPNFIVQAAVPVPKGGYMLLTEAVVPTDAPSGAVTLVLKQGGRGKRGMVVDSAPDVKGRPASTWDVANPTVDWTSSRASRPSIVTIGFDILTEVDTRCLVIQTAEGLTLDTANKDAVEVVRGAFPKKKGRWYDMSYLTRMLMFSSRVLATGTYKFRFPVYLPEATKPKNVWLIAFCDPTDDRCDPATAQMVLPVPGLTVGWSSQPDVVATTSGALALVAVWVFS